MTCYQEAKSDEVGDIGGQGELNPEYAVLVDRLVAGIVDSADKWSLILSPQLDMIVAE